MTIENNRVTSVSLVTELVSDFLSYSTSIYNRALPDIVDGLKIAQRRSLLGLKDLSLTSKSPYCKVSRLEGHVLGKYHPQGGCSGTVINMGQQSAMRYVLTDIHGNAGGSIQTGPAIGQLISEDAPAAARYLEVRATPLCESLYLSQIDRGLGLWRQNYDDTTTEPVRIVPALPALLLTGAQGIASGYACYHVPYSVKDVVSVTSAWIRNRSLSDKQIVSKFSEPPEPPQGGRVEKSPGLSDIILHGRGQFTVYGEWEIDDSMPWRKKSVRPGIVITRLAHGSSEKFLEKVRDLADTDRLPGLIDAADHSSRDGIRIVLVTKTVPERDEILATLVAATGLKHQYNVNCTAVGLDGMPRTVGVRDVIEAWYGERVSYLTQRYTAEKASLESESEKLTGLVTILDEVGRFVDIVKKSSDKVTAVASISKRWKLTEPVARYLLTIPISTLIRTEGEKVRLELEKIRGDIASLEPLCSTGGDLDTHILSQIASQRGLQGPGRCLWMTVGVPVAKAVNKPILVKEKIITEGRGLGMSIRSVNQWISDNVGKGSIATKWDLYKEEYEHRVSMTTRAGKQRRKERLLALRADAESRGLPTRGRYGWKSFMAGHESARIDRIVLDLEAWIEQHAKPSKTATDTRATSPRSRRGGKTSNG
jgi:DNA gyrase subunit A